MMLPQADKLPKEMKPVDLDNNISWMLKPGHQTFFVPYSSDNHGNIIFVFIKQLIYY